jgi:hypothetical protein
MLARTYASNLTPNPDPFHWRPPGSLERHVLRSSACSMIVKMKAPGPLANSSEPHI